MAAVVCFSGAFPSYRASAAIWCRIFREVLQGGSELASQFDILAAFRGEPDMRYRCAITGYGDSCYDRIIIIPSYSVIQRVKHCWKCAGSGLPHVSKLVDRIVPIFSPGGGDRCSTSPMCPLPLCASRTASTVVESPTTAHPSAMEA